MLRKINPLAAGIDVGSEQMHVSIAGGPAQIFGSVTAQLHALRDYLRAAEVKTVAMEATGIYWLALYEVLEEAGLEVLVVNGAHVRNLPGRKTDISDCQWLAELHAYGLLRGGFVPPAAVRRLRDYQRLREDHLSLAAGHVLHMQKALERMNLKIHDVLSDLCGVSGLALVRAILAGERDLQRLLALCDQQIRKRKRERMEEALRGTWRSEHLFALGQALEGWEFYQRQIQRCDEQIGMVLREMAPPASGRDGSQGKAGPSSEGEAKAKRSGKNAPAIEGLDGLLTRIFGGAQPGRLPGLTNYSALQLLSEVGSDLRAWKSAKHFTSWLGLAPGTRQSGKRRRNQPRKGGRAGRIFVVVARSVGRTADTALGGFYRRIRGLRGGLVASKALGRKLAELFYYTLTKGVQYVEEGLAKYQERYRQLSAKRLAKTARKLGLTISPILAPTS
jgi:transposase